MSLIKLVLFPAHTVFLSKKQVCSQLLLKSNIFCYFKIILSLNGQESELNGPFLQFIMVSVVAEPA